MRSLYSKRGFLGDGPVNAFDALLDGVLSGYFQAFERAPSEGELIGFIEFCRSWVKADGRRKHRKTKKGLKTKRNLEPRAK